MIKKVAGRVRLSLRRRWKRAGLAWACRTENGRARVLLAAALNLLNVRATVRLRVDGVDLLLRTTTTDLQSARTCLEVEYRDTLDFIPVRDGLMVDAGGHIGCAAIAFARHFPDARIVCLEPCPENYRLCLRNTAAFPNIEVWQAALAGHRGNLPLYGRKTGFEGNTLVATAEDRTGNGPITMVQTVDVRTLLGAFEAERIAFLKLDIEGAERELFTAPDWLSLVDVVFVELHDRIAAGCSAAFTAANTGRRVFDVGGEKKLSIHAHVDRDRWRPVKVRSSAHLAA